MRNDQTMKEEYSSVRDNSTDFLKIISEAGSLLSDYERQIERIEGSVSKFKNAPIEKNQDGASKSEIDTGGLIGEFEMFIKRFHELNRKTSNLASRLEEII